MLVNKVLTLTESASPLSGARDKECGTLKYSLSVDFSL